MMRRADGWAAAVRRVVAVAGGLLLAVAALSGCTAGAPHSVGPRFAVSRDPSPVWEPVGIRLLALPPGERVTVTATVTAGAVWTSQAVYLVPAGGEVDFGSQAPLAAPFHGADGMGLFWSLASTSGAPATSGETWDASTVTVTLVARIAGRAVAETDVHRIGLFVAAPSRAVFDDGILGDYFEPTVRSVGLKPAVIVFDGTDTGTPTGVLAASLISALGYPALALSTYGSAGQLDPRHTFPAERFTSALSWLRSQPGVDPERVFTFGTSRGAQLALWTAVAFSDDVYGAIAPAGTTGVICNSPIPSPSVTVNGSWVPCTIGTRQVDPAAVLDLGSIRGPIVLGCAGRDEQLDNGCAWMTAGQRARGTVPGDVFLRAPDSTHLFYVPPYTPLYLATPRYAQATEDARVALWRAIAATLRGSVEG
ncbi:acyl-CoA thioesterase/BAAT N-terminal domain-containing protein [Leifsonia sp. NPDC058248]|uniref:acyl-CoA thioesterase/BAAT N-terminal domain-containing protein n=1 Tax=Leifsonia sp. NPDC058248 TaxID=3346402 RepID=UPI0036DAC6F2